MMKKMLFTVALCLFVSVSFAQVKFGIKGGVGLSNILEFNAYSKQRAGLQAGIFAEIPLGASDTWYLKPEVLFSAQGETNQSPAYSTDNFNEDYYLNYINVPILIRAYFAKTSQGSFFIELGPQIGFLVWKDIESTTMKDDDFKTIDVAAAGGVGYSFGRKFELYARYTRGFIDSVDHDLRDDDNHTSVISFGVGFTF